MIGKQINKPVKDWKEYRQAAKWANENSARIDDMGSYYEVVAIPEPTDEEKAALALEQAKAERAEAVSAITVEVDGMVFDGDETSQERMARTVAIATANGMPMTTETTWVLADNAVAQVTLQQLAQACLLAGQKQTELWTKPYEADDAETE